MTNKFNPLSVSSKFAICGLPIRMDTYKSCGFGCKYCFANNRKIMEFDKHLSFGNVAWLQKKLDKVLAQGRVDETNFLEVLIRKGITFHCGGMSDPFQPCERKYGITAQCVDVCNKYGRTILFSTKSDTVYDANIDPRLHTFQLSVTGCGKDVEPGVPDLEKRKQFYRALKADGFRVGIRIQPFIPNVSTLDIVKEFSDADHFTLEGLKIVPQNQEAKEFILETFGLEPRMFTQMGLLNLKPEIRRQMYKPFIEWFEAHGISYSIADNDMHDLGNNYCCCGDKLVAASLRSCNTTMCHLYGRNYTKEQMDEMLAQEQIIDCVCNNLFTSNRQEGCKTVGEFYDKRFFRKSSPFSPGFLLEESEMFDFESIKDTDE